MLNPPAASTPIGGSSASMKLMTGAEENRHFLRAFIHTYRELPVLWDTTLRDYTNRDKRAEAYEQLVPIYRYLKRDATVEDVKKKINTLRTNYRKELKVVECARRAGNVHQPRCWTFHELDFLRNTEKFLAVNPNQSRGEPFSFNDSSQTQTSFIDTTHSNYNFRGMMALGGSPMPSGHATPNISEMFQKSFGQTQKVEPEQTPPPLPLPPTPTSSTAHAQSQHSGPATPGSYSLQSMEKRPRLAAAGNVSQSTSSQSPEELLNIACDYLSGTFPEEESIARTWTHKLKRMQREQRLLAEKFINEILFEAETGNLHRGSVQINSFEPYVRFEEQQSSEEQNKSQASPSVPTSTNMQSESEMKNVTQGENIPGNTRTETNYENYANMRPGAN